MFLDFNEKNGLLFYITFLTVLFYNRLYINFVYAKEEFLQLLLFVMLTQFSLVYIVYYNDIQDSLSLM